MIYTTTVTLTRPDRSITWNDPSVIPTNLIKEKHAIGLDDLSATLIFETTTIPVLPPTDTVDIYQVSYRQQHNITRSVIVKDESNNVVLTYQD